jgi:hypothetical protein
VIENKNQGDTCLLKIDRVTGDTGIVSHNVRKTMWYWYPSFSQFLLYNFVSCLHQFISVK